jgi:hypothetical protein
LKSASDLESLELYRTATKPIYSLYKGALVFSEQLASANGFYPKRQQIEADLNKEMERN